LLGPLNLRWCLSRHVDAAYTLEAVDWVIVGGESGADHRGMDISWLENVVNQCGAAHVPVWVKQDSAYRSERQGRIPDAYWIHEWPKGVRV
jgi:protein gp37